jgi:hypothetical protein
VRGGFLLDGNGGRQAFDVIDIRLFHQGQELAGIGRQGFNIAALAFGIEGVEGEGGLAGAGQAGNHHELVAGQVEVDVLEVVGACAANLDLVHGGGDRPEKSNRRVYGKRRGTSLLAGRGIVRDVIPPVAEAATIAAFLMRHLPPD